jgi:hypothetical protein
MQTLENEIRSAIAASDAGADETDGSETKKILGRVPFRATRFDQRHAKHAVALERVLEHVAVAVFENIKWQKCVWKKDRTRQWHHRHFIGQIYRPIFHFRFPSLEQFQRRSAERNSSMDRVPFNFSPRGPGFDKHRALVDSSRADAEHPRRMLFNLLRWLDASPARYWTVAWAAFGGVVALALLAILFRRERAWWQHPVLFSAAMLIVLLAFRWPIIFDNRQYPDPDESQLIAGASMMRHDPVFWRSVDGSTHGPVDEWPLVAALFVRGSLDFTAARMVSTLLNWVELVTAWLIFRHLYKASAAGLLVLPLLAAHAFTHAWSFVAYCSEHVPDALLALGCWSLLTAWRQSGAGPPSLARLFTAGVLLGAVPFAKLQGTPIAAVAVAGAVWFTLFDHSSDWHRRWRALGAIFSGAATVPAIILGMVMACGLWSDFIYSYILDNIRFGSGQLTPRTFINLDSIHFAGGREFTWTEAPRMLIELGGSIFGFNEFFLWLVVVGACGLLLFPWFTRWHRRCAMLSAAMLFFAALAAMAPGRAFIHYLQLAIFPAGLFGGLIAGAVLQNVPREGFITGVSVRVLRAVVIVAFLSCALGPQIWWRVHEPQPFIGQFTATQGALAQSEVSREILRRASPGERLAIWGWMPMFWVETGLLQATRDGNSQRQSDPYRYRDYFRARYLRDLSRTRPPVFIDAVGVGNLYYENRAKIAHETFPELRDYIADNYHLVQDVGGTRVYVRNDRL